MPELLTAIVNDILLIFVGMSFVWLCEELIWFTEHVTFGRYRPWDPCPLYHRCESRPGLCGLWPPPCLTCLIEPADRVVWPKEMAS